MKMLKSVYIAAFLWMGLTSVQAQNQKIGFIDSEYILTKIPEYNGIFERLNQLTAQWREQLNEQMREVERLQKDLEAKEILYTPEIRAQRQREIDEKVTQMNAYRTQRFGPDGEYYKTQKDLIEPLQQRVLQAVNKIAQRDNFDFVFDRQGDYLFLFAKPQWNLSDEVLLELGIDVGETSN